MVVDEPEHGTLDFDPDGSFTYTPDLNYHGPDSFTFKANDGSLDSNVATVSITVTPVNDPPVATDETATTAEDTPISFTQADLAGDDTDVDADTLTVTAVGNAVNGTVIDNGDGTFTFTPAAHFHGTASFEYTVSDGHGGTDIGLVTITVTPVADDPIAVDDTRTVFEDSEDNPVVVLTNDSDPDGDTFTVTEVGTPSHGDVSLGPSGITYTPDADYFGPDSFTYTITDSTGRTDSATVHVTVTPVNDPPVANNDSATVAEDSIDHSIDVLANDNDGVDAGETLTVTAVSDPAHGTAVIGPGGTSVLYTPDPNYFGPDSFTYTISDGNGGTATATVDVTVTAVNDAPVAVDDTAATQEDTDVTLTEADLKGTTPTLTTRMLN